MYVAEGFTVRFGSRTILDKVNLTLTPGKVTVVIGPNGAGKSTLLKAMAGERRPDAGSVTLHGRDVYRTPPRELAARRAVLAQSVSLSAPFSVDEIVRLGIPAMVRTEAADALVARGLAAVDMRETGPRPITQLSGGEQQRIHAARVLIQLWVHGNDEARYLLLDEPTTHLDPAHQLLLLKLAREHAVAGGGVMAILHDLNLALAVADEIAVLHRGRIIAHGPPETTLTEALVADVYGVPFAMIESGGRRWVIPRFGKAV